MIFHDENVKRLDLTRSDDVQKLIEFHLCGHTALSELAPSDRKLLDEFVTKAMPAGVTFQQFNELLLVLNQDRVSRAFFEFFFGNADLQVPFARLQEGVVRFKGFAIVCFGNFRFAFRRLSKIDDLASLREELGFCCQSEDEALQRYSTRAEKILDVELISRDHSWFVGEITGRVLSKELTNFEKYREENPKQSQDDEVLSFAKALQEMDRSFEQVQEAALRNTDVYLTWDHLDVYVATSMRNKWEYEEVFDFVDKLFRSPVLTPMKLRYFDPTQSKCRTSRDKGLLEGLMLKRAYCTIYMAQETDTLGKDSELANTLAQGKPVIAYVPQVNAASYSRIIQDRPLQFAKQRLLHLLSLGMFDDVDDMRRLAHNFLEDLAAYRKAQPCELWSERDTKEFKRAKEYWVPLCDGIAKAEEKAFDRRAAILQQFHPLGMQMNLKTGVANGVLVIRSAERCADLLKAILTNKAEFDFKVDEGGQVLVERNSESVFRAVTNNEKLTNSFWNLWTQ